MHIIASLKPHAQPVPNRLSKDSGHVDEGAAGGVTDGDACGGSDYGVSELKIEIDEDERTLTVRALEQYHAYQVSQQREDRRYSDLANRINMSGQ